MRLKRKTFESHKRTVEALVGRKQSRRLFEAIKKDIPIVIYERNTLETIDGELYRSLKMLGAKQVYNFDLLFEKEQKVFDVFCAVFNVGHS